MEDKDFFAKVNELIGLNSSFAIATVIASEGSTLAKPGFKLLLSSDLKVVTGSLGGGCPESALIPTAKKAFETGKPMSLKVHLEESEKALEGMIRAGDTNEVYVETFCGGNLTIFIEPYLPTRRVILVAQGGNDSVEDALLEILPWAGFSTVLATPFSKEDTKADSVFNVIEHDIKDFDYRESDSMIVLTKGEKDVEVLEKVSDKKLHYVGLLASRKRSAKDFEDLRNRKVDTSFIESVHTPIGLDIRAISPREIALSIVVQLIKSYNEK